MQAWRLSAAESKLVNAAFQLANQLQCPSPSGPFPDALFSGSFQ